MLDSIFATKLDMTQAWSKQGKRLAVTRCRVDDNFVVDQKSDDVFEVGYGQKKLKNMSKPLRSKMQKSGFSVGVTKLQGVHQPLQAKPTEDENENADQIKVGDIVKAGQVLEIGDVVKVQGTTKGRGFTGVMKRWGFSGGQRTHGQSDRERAPGSIGAGTDPGRVWPGKKMPGHYGGDTKTISGLVVIYINSDTNEVWLSGPVPGHYSSIVKISKTGQKKLVELDNDASGILVKDEVLKSEQAEPREEEAKE
jgi:large subunit ribosomal protein L3